MSALRFGTERYEGAGTPDQWTDHLGHTVGATYASQVRHDPTVLSPRVAAVPDRSRDSYPRPSHGYRYGLSDPLLRPYVG